MNFTFMDKYYLGGLLIIAIVAQTTRKTNFHKYHKSKPSNLIRHFQK
jgi:hypothetical protein